jgi:hypothetical protein
MTIENFADLLNAARAQPEMQRLLLVFADAEIGPDASPAQRAAYEAGHGGTLAPGMCVDKGLEELSTFDALVQEAAQLGNTWSLVFAAALPGGAQQEPTAQQVDMALQAMVEAIQRGEVARYLAFDRHGLSVLLE